MRRPPVSASLAAALVAGALVGLGARAAIALGVAAGSVGLALASRRRRAFEGLIAATLGFGCLHGLAGRLADGFRCADRLPEGVVTVRVRVEEPTAGRLPARARPLEAGCGGSIEVRWPDGGRVEAGDRRRVEGRWISKRRALGAADGLLVVRRSEIEARRPDPLDRLRNWLHRTSRRLYGARAGIVDALVLGRRGGIDPAQSGAFVRAGLVHILAISGFHVGIIGGWTLLLLGLGGLSRPRARRAAALVVTCYVVFLGLPAPAVRAAALAWLVTIETERQRHPTAGSLLGITAIAMVLVDPFAVVSVGAWLSVSALAGATWLSRWSDRRISRRGPVRIAFGSAGATLGTAPVAALALGTVAPIGVVANLAAIPVAALAVPAVLASLVLAALGPWAAAGMSTGAGLLLSALEAIANAAAGIPGGAMVFDPGPRAALWGLLALVGTGLLLRDRPTGREAGRRAAWIAAAGLTGALLIGGWRAGNAGGQLTLYFLSVGQGDATLIETGGHHWVLVDAGPRDRRSDAGRRVVVPFLIRHGVRVLDALVLSHAHLDHFGGAPAVLDRVRARIVLEPGRPSGDPAYRDLLDGLDQEDLPWSALRAGQSFAIDGVRFEVLHPDTAWAGWGEDLNEDSVVLRIRAGDFSAMLMGDAGAPVEHRLAGRAGRVDLLKVGHHGSATASTEAWLRELAPAAAVVSTGPNRYGHPAPEALARLDGQGIALWRTDREGTVTVMVGEGRMRIRSRRGTRSFPLRVGPPPPG